MRQERHYFVYILGSFTGTLYVGVTSNLPRRVWQHKQHAIEGFTAEYDVTRLLYFEVYDHVVNAIAREKQLKGWLRGKEDRAHREEESALGRSYNSREWNKPDTQPLTVKIMRPEDRRG